MEGDIGRGIRAEKRKHELALIEKGGLPQNQKRMMDARMAMENQHRFYHPEQYSPRGPQMEVAALQNRANMALERQKGQNELERQGLVNRGQMGVQGLANTWAMNVQRQSDTGAAARTRMETESAERVAQTTADAKAETAQQDRYNKIREALINAYPTIYSSVGGLREGAPTVGGFVNQELGTGSRRKTLIDWRNYDR